MMPLSRQLRRLARQNWVLTATVGALLVIGVLFVYSACYVNGDPQSTFPKHQKQIVWAIAGMLCYMAFASTDYRKVNRAAWWIYFACLVLLLAVLIMGIRIYGAKRWLIVFGLQFQPSEATKLAVILVLARRLARPGADLSAAGVVIEILLIVLVPIMLIMKEPDMGTALVFVPTVFAMMLVGGIPLKTIATLIALGVTMAGVVLGILFLPEKLGVSEASQKSIMRVVGLGEYHKDRIRVFLSRDADPLGVGWNKMQSEIAVGSGGMWGKGFLKGTQNTLGFLPRSVSPTDFIYSVIAEESGFVGSMTVLLLFIVVLVCGMYSSLAARTRLGRLLCVGITVMLFSHVFTNVAMTIGLMPIIGIPLPLLSYGGSFMLVMMSALGILQSVYIEGRQTGGYRDL
jgi:rod shape determining protein RodA